MPNPARHDGAVDRNALAGVDVGLTMQRQVIAELRDDDVGEQRRPRPALLDRQRRHRRLDDGLAGPAAHLRAHMHDALEVGSNVFEHLALVGADPAELLSAAGRAHARRFVDDGLHRQMVGQGRAERRLARLRRRCGGLARLRLHDSGARERLGGALFEIVDHEFELLDLRLEFFGGTAEAGATKNGELRAQLLDHQRLGVNLGPEPGDVALQIAGDAAQIVGIAGQIRRRRRHGHV